jgi:alpha-beta hydrolase superfamily lysophospholipase
MSFLHDLIYATLGLIKPETITKTPPDFPLLFIAVDEDPVGREKAEYVREVVGTFKDAGLTDVSANIYEGARHELLNEANRKSELNPGRQRTTRIVPAHPVLL